MSRAGTAFIDVRGDFSQFDRQGKLAAGRFQRNVDSLAVGSLKRTGQTLQETGRAFKFAAAGAAAFGGAAVIHAIKTGAQFEQQMSRVKAVSKASGAEMRLLNADAIRLGKDTKFSAKQAAEGMYELSSAGFSVRETHKALPGVLALAAASNIDLASAAEISSNALRGFGLDASKSGHVADVMTSAVNKASLEMSDLKDSIKYVGPIGKATGQSLEVMVAAIAEMSNQGIKGEQAGTSLRGALVRLTKPTKQAQEGLHTLGVSAKDLQGPNGLKPLPDLIRVLTSHQDNLTKSQRNQALAQVFGTEALTGMLAVVNQGPDKLEKLSRAFDHSNGAAKKASKTMMDNVSGSFEQLKGSVETAEIELFQKFSPTLKKTLDQATRDVNKFLTTLEKDPGFKSGDDVFGAIRRAFKASGLERDLKRELDKVDWQGLLDGAIEKVAEGGGKLALAAARGFAHSFINGDPLTRLALGAFFITKFVGWQNIFRRLGTKAGSGFAEGIATTAVPGIQAAVAGGGGKGAKGGRGGLIAGDPRNANIPGALPGGLIAGDPRNRNIGNGKALPVSLLPPAGEQSRMRTAFSNYGTGLGNALTRGVSRAVRSPVVKGFGIFQAISGAAGVASRLSQGKGLGDSLQGGLHDATLGIVPDADEERLRNTTDLVDKLQKKLNGLSTVKQPKALADTAQTLRDFAKSDWGKAFDKGQLEAAAKQFDKTGGSIRRVLNNFGQLEHGATNSLRKTRRATDQNWTAIRQLFGTQSQRGVNAAKRNFAAGFTSIKHLEDSHVISHKKALQEIARLYKDYLQFFGFTPKEAANISRPGKKGQDAHPVSYTGGLEEGHHARGGLVQFGRPGQTGPDSIPTTIGGKRVVVAPGEVAAVFNGDQIADVNQELAHRGGLGGFFTGKQWRKHAHAQSARAYAHGGIVEGAHLAYGGVTPPIAKLIRKLDSMGFHHGSTTSGGHAPGGFHPRGMAVDYGDASNDMQRLWSTVFPSRQQFAELFGPSRLKPGPHLMHNGVGFSDAGLQADHEDHIHMALAAALGALGGAAVKKIGRFLVNGPGGPLKAVSQRGLDTAVGAANSRLAAVAAQSGGDVTVSGGAIGGSGSGMALMKSISRERGWNFGDWWALDGGESSHGRNLANPTSSARLRGQFMDFNYGKYGPGSDPRQNPSMDEQIRSMALYIAKTYGNPTKAYHAWLGRHPHWYELGGLIPAAAGLAPGALGKRAYPGRGLANHFNPFTGHTSLMTSDEYNQLKERWRKQHPGTAMPTSASKAKPKKRKPHHHNPRVSAAVRHLASIKYRTPGEQSWFEKQLDKLDGKIGHDDKTFPHLSHVLESLDAQYLVDDDQNSDTPDVVNQHGLSIDGKFIPGIDQAVAALNDMVANRSDQLAQLLQQKNISDLGLAPTGFMSLQKTIDRYKKLYDKIAAKVKENARRIRRTKDELRTLGHKKHPTKADHQRAVKLHDQLADLHRDQKALTGDDEPKTDPAAMHGFSEDTPLGKAWHDLTTVRTQRKSLADRASTLSTDIVDKGDEISDLRTQIEDATGTKPPKAELTAGAEDPSAALLRQLLDQSHLETQISQRQYDVLRDFPQFGGSFDTGGVVPGPVGAARMILAHGGETVLPTHKGPVGGDGVVVELRFANGMEWLRQFVQAEVKQSDRSTARAAGRGLPGRGGGVLG